MENSLIDNEQFKKALEEVNERLYELQGIQTVFGEPTQEYRESLKKEIELLKKKRNLMKFSE